MSATPLDDLPLKRLLVCTPLTTKLLLVSRWPLAKMFWLPRPALVPEPVRKSALTPGLRRASCVKLPVPSGVLSINSVPSV